MVTAVACVSAAALCLQRRIGPFKSRESEFLNVEGFLCERLPSNDGMGAGREPASATGVQVPDKRSVIGD